LSLVPLAAGVFLLVAPVENPGVQQCGAPIAFAITGRTNERLLRPPDPDAAEQVDALRAQTPCNELVERRFAQGSWALVGFVGLALVGAVLGLIDDRLRLREAPRFEDLLRERPTDAPGPVWDQPVVPREDIGRALPEIESADVDAFVVWSLATVVLLTIVSGVRSLLDALGDLEPVAVFALLVGACVARLVSTAELVALEPNRPGDRGRLARAARVVVATDWAARMRPAFGTVGVTAHYLIRGGEAPSRALVDTGAATVVAFAVHGVLLAFLGLITVVIGTDGSWPPYALLLFLAAFFMGVAGVVVLSARLHRLPCTLDRTTIGHLADRVSREPLDIVHLLVPAVVLPLVHGVVVFYASSAFGPSPPLIPVMFVTMTALAVGSLAPVPEGFVAADSVMVLGLSSCGVAPVAAVGATLAWRVVMVWLPLVPGLFATRQLIRDGVL
jgi:uncharacterized membrane protein YbhN (UPF0104 family)